MKKILFSIVACMALATGSFASNEIVKTKVKKSEKEFSKEPNTEERGF